MSVEDVNTKVAAAVAAHEGGDTATALLYLRSARMLLAGLPDVTKGDRSLRYDRASIDNMIQDLEREAARPAVGSRGVRYTKVKYRQPDACEE